jgi:plastocyanin
LSRRTLKSNWRPTVVVAATVALAAVAAGCGNATEAGSADLVNGKKLFVGDGTCGACHTLQRAGTKGTQGPDLDQAFANARENGFGNSVIEGVVRDQIAHPRRNSIMKPDLVTGDNARDVAAYVGEAAAKPGKDGGLLATVGVQDTSNASTSAKGGKLTIPAAEAGLAFQFGKATAPAGKLTIEMPNPASIQHDIALKPPAKGKGPTVGKGGVSSFTTTLKPGSYEYYCSVPGHEQGGMKGTLTVK